MKKIEAIVRPHKVDQILKALAESSALSGESALGVTVLETVGFGRQRGHSDVYRGAEQDLGLVPKRMLMMYVGDDEVEGVVKLIKELAHTGKPGDGKVAVSEIVGLTRVRTGEEGDIAL